MQVLPEDRRRIASDGCVGSHEGHAVQNGLRNQASVEGVSVMRRQQVVVRGAQFVEWQRLY